MAAPGYRASQLLNFVFILTDAGFRLRDVSIFLTNQLQVFFIHSLL